MTALLYCYLPRRTAWRSSASRRCTVTRPLDVTDRTTRDLVAILSRAGARSLPVYRGSEAPLGEGDSVAPAPAQAALHRALEEEPLTLVSLGPLTKVAAALRDRPDLQVNVVRLVAVMGRRLGHLFHPAEGADGGILFGHGPVFRDFNFDKDRLAVTLVLGMRLPTTLIPYEAARGVNLTGADLSRLEAQGGAAAWVASRAWDWLDFWKEDIGRDGFYPFDLLAGAYVIGPHLFDCAELNAWVDEDPKLWDWFYSPEALLVGLAQERPTEVRASSPVVYCPQIDARLHRWLMARLVAPDQTIIQRGNP